MYGLKFLKYLTCILSEEIVFKIIVVYPETLLRYDSLCTHVTEESKVVNDDATQVMFKRK